MFQKMKKSNANILLVIPDYSSFRKPILTALNKLKFHTFEFDYRKTNTLEKIFFLISKIFPSVRIIAVRKINKRLTNEAKTVNASIIFVVKGELIYPETISYFNREGILTINWYPDYFNQDPKIISQVKEYKFVFQSDTYEISKLRKKGFNNFHYLAWAGEAKPPKKKFKKIYPITFIGTYTEEREKILSSLKGMPLFIWGDSKWAKSSLKTCFQGNRLQQEEMFEKIYKSKVIINMHRTKSKKTIAANLRCFEVTGAKQFLLTDYRKDLTNLFKIGKEVVCFKDAK